MKPIFCPKCRRPAPLELLAAGTPFACPTCRSQLAISVFPAIHRSIERGQAPELAQIDGEATCYFHAEKKAAALCDDCGRFLCALCDMPVGGRHLCPKCLERGRTRKTITTLENHRTSYPSLALSMAILPILISPLTILTGPLTVFLVLYGWNKPPSLTSGRRRLTLSIALIIGLVQCTVWGYVFLNLYRGALRG